MKIMDRLTDGPTDGRTDGPTDGPIDRPTDGQTDGQNDRLEKGSAYPLALFRVASSSESLFADRPKIHLPKYIVDMSCDIAQIGPNTISFKVLEENKR